MNQHLYVEGKDYYFIGALCSKHFPVPKGYTENNKKKFLKGGGGYDETKDSFIESLNTADLANVGLIVDADFKSIQKRFDEIKKAISQKLGIDLSKYQLNTEGVIIEEEGFPKIGIWIMPDNKNDGYLEYFIEQLIDNQDVILTEAKEAVDNLMLKEHCRFTAFKKQKAIVHSWLAWQKSPGLPFGSALEAGYLNHNTESINPFLNWIKNTFEF
jgi:hypothetical protein